MQTSSTSPVLEFYRNIINSPHLLADGYAIISKFLFESQQNRRDTILNLLDPHVPILSLLINIYPQEIFQSEAVDQTEKDSTVQFLMDLLVGELLKPSELVRKKVVDQLFEFMHKIHNSQGFTQWVGVYLSACSKLEGSGSSRLAYFLINVFKYADDRVSVLTQQILKSIVGYEFTNQEEKLQIYYYVLKSLAFKVDTDPEAIESFVAPYEQAILEYATTNMKRSAITLKFSLKIMTLLFGDYGVECPLQFVKQVEQTAASLIQEYVLFLNNSNGYWKGVAEIEQDDQQPIETALYQMLQLFMTLFGARVKLNLQTMVYLCIISTFLGEEQYKKYVQLPDQYLMDIEDEGEMNIRNKSIFFLQEMLQHEKIGKKCVLFLREYTLQVLGNLSLIDQQIKNFLAKYKLPLVTLKVSQLYKESALFILYSFTDELLEGNTTKMSVVLGNEVKANTTNSIDTILAIVILNKCLSSQPANQKQYYILFLRQMCGKYSSNVGMLIALARGIHKYFPEEETVIVNTINEKGVPFILIDRLMTYLQGDDSAQEESGYLILEFFIYLLKNQQNNAILKNIITFEREVVILKKYLKNGISEGLVCDLTCKLANPFTLQALYKQIQNGFVKDETLSKIISKCLRNKTIVLSELQIIDLCQKYNNNLDLVSEIVSAYIQTVSISNAELALFLSTKQKKEWIPGLLKQGKLANIQTLFISTVVSITNEIDSLQQLQNQLVVPYFIILQNTQNAIATLNSHNILVQFLEKVYRYSRLFQGVHLKIMTSHVFITLAERLPHLVAKIIELIQFYGNLESSQWQEDDLDIQDLDNGEAADGIIEKMFNRIVNDRLEEVLKTVFGELSWDSKKLYERLALLQGRV